MVGIVLIGHGPLASGLLQAAEMIAGPQSGVAVLELQPAQDMDQFREEMERAVARVDAGQGVLILADLFGGSPANTSAYLLRPGVDVVCGLNLPMLLEVLTMRDSQTLSELAQTALRAGASGCVRLADMLGQG
ncbi:MAG: PTS sugar transporter subunit IIA [Symbiobacteriaceae bacterium]